MPLNVGGPYVRSESFSQPVDTYQRDYRAIHYAVLFIALT
jgi:inner membrane protein involved in colicin E2 resistance